MGIGYGLYLPHLSQKGVVCIEELDGSLISMGDDHTCWLVGKGTVCIKMYDKTMRELKEMRYIPCMTKNLSQ